MRMHHSNACHSMPASPIPHRRCFAPLKTPSTTRRQLAVRASGDKENAPETTSVREALRAAQQRQQAQQRQPSGRGADSTDWISSQLTRRFGIAGGLAWLGFLTFGAVSEQIKTRLEVASEEAGRKEVKSAKEVTTPSGVRYTDVVLRLVVDGQTLLDTAARGRPLAFIYGSRPSGGVTRGLEEALATMSAGGKRTVVVPPALAYGEEGAVLTPNPKKPDDVVRIPPGATLVYTVELTRVSIAPS